MYSDIKRFTNLNKIFKQSKKEHNPKNLFNPDPYYDMLRQDVDDCCEIAFRYGLVLNEEKGLLQGRRYINQNSTLYELRVARLFEKYFGKGCLNWDPSGAGASVGEFLLNIKNADKEYKIFVEIKTREIQRLTQNGLFRSNDMGILTSLQKSYSKIESNNIPSLVILCHNHFNIAIDESQIVRVCFGRVAFNKVPEIISHGYFFDHKNLSATGLYYFYVNPETQKLQEYFEVFHNHFAQPQIDKHIFENKANKQFILAEWDGNFTNV